jgi:hypothetical protein
MSNIYRLNCNDVFAITKRFIIWENMMTENKKYRMDIILIVILLILALIAAVAVYLTHDKGGTVVVKVDGAVVSELPISEDTELIVEGYQGGTNRIIIQGSEVFASEADCPDALCVKTGKISRAGETIVCLPHRVVVEIKGKAGGSEDGVDSVAR